MKLSNWIYRGSLSTTHQHPNNEQQLVLVQNIKEDRASNTKIILKTYVLYVLYI